MTDWSKLERELDAWSEAGWKATFWWRDDDAISVTPELERLVETTIGNHVPLGLAVIPAGADKDLVAWLTDQPEITVLQHGLAHLNHAHKGEKAAELGMQRGLQAVLADIKQGQLRIADFNHTAPILVPPWNRIDPALFPSLSGLGFSAVSCFAPRKNRFAAPGLAFLNTHLDPHNFKKKEFVGADRAIHLLTEHLEARRHGAADRDEPTGILTHHLVHPPEAWNFLGELAGRLDRHAAAQCLSPAKALK